MQQELRLERPTEPVCPFAQDPELQPAALHPHPLLQRAAVPPSAVSTPARGLPLVLCWERASRTERSCSQLPFAPSPLPPHPPNPIVPSHPTLLICSVGQREPQLKRQPYPVPAHFLLWNLAKPSEFLFLYVQNGTQSTSFTRIRICNYVLHPRAAQCAAFGRSSNDHYFTVGPSGFRRALLIL